MEKIENGSSGLLSPDSLGEGESYFHYLWLGEEAFALMLWMVKPYSRRQLTREERIASRDRRVEQNTFGILLSGFRVLMDTMEQRPKVVRANVITWVLLHNILGTHQGRSDRLPTQANDLAEIRNNLMVYVPDGNYWNPLCEAKHQQALLKDYSNNTEALAGQEDNI